MLRGEITYVDDKVVSTSLFPGKQHQEIVISCCVNPTKNGVQCCLKPPADSLERPGCVPARGRGWAGPVAVAAALHSSEWWPGLCWGWRSGRCAGWWAGSRYPPSYLEDGHTRGERLSAGVGLWESSIKTFWPVERSNWVLDHHQPPPSPHRPPCMNKSWRHSFTGTCRPPSACLPVTLCTVWLHNWPCATGSTLNQQRVIDPWGSGARGWGLGAGGGRRANRPPERLPHFRALSPPVGLQRSPVSLCNLPESFSHNSKKQLEAFTWIFGWDIKVQLTRPAPRF